MSDNNSAFPAGAAKGADGTQARKRALDGVRRRYDSQCVSTRIHGFVFLIGSAGLIFLNAVSTRYPWAFFPIAGWVVGLAAHLRARFNRRYELGRLGAVPGAPDEAVRLLRQYQRSRGAWLQHLSAYVTTNLYVWGINIVTSTVFWWAPIVSGAWGVGLGCHWMAGSARRKGIKRRLREYGIDLDSLRPAYGADGEDGAYRPLTEKARALADGMAAKYRASKGLRSHWAGIEPLLRTAVAQIAELEDKSVEFDRMTASIANSEVERDLAELKRKRELAGTELLRKEYDRSIAQYESHLKASSDLAQHREILDLRLSSALNLIKQLDIDSVRLASLESYEEPASIALLRAKTDENQAFLADFRSGLERLETDG